MVDHQVTEARVTVLADCGVEADRVAVVVEQLGQDALFDLEGFGQFGQCGRAAVLGLQLSLHPAGAADLVTDVSRDADGVGRVLDGTPDRLADPPGRVGGELEALAPVELLDGVDQAEVAFLDQVGEGQARPLVLAGYGYDKPKVGVDELGCGVIASGDGLAKVAFGTRCQASSSLQLLASCLGTLDDLPEAHFVCLGKQRKAPGLIQV